ncbi:hypothetical protein N665_0218s0042 [Sinapis alba]|nr:hypothetical protein N665_0218s0042 [Sinapis alba]
MGDSLSIKLAMPELKYQIGSVPSQNVSINQYSSYAYINIVNNILREDEFNRIRETFLGPMIKLGKRSLKLSWKIVHTILTRSIKIMKKHEAWFHFLAQPMRFKWDYLMGTHMVEDVENQLRHADEDASDGRFCLAMLLLIESILLNKSGKMTFPLDYVKKAQDIDFLMTYPWGRYAYELLLKSFKRVVDKNLEKKKYELHGFPLAFHLWILESIPLLQSNFSTLIPFLEVQPSTPVFLFEKYVVVKAPSLKKVLEIENKENLKVTCILFSIPHDTEADVSIEYEADQDLGQQNQTANVNESTFSQAEESMLPTLFEIGTYVEIASNDDTTCRTWYPGSVVATNLVDGVAVRPQPPPNNQRPGKTKGFEMMDNMEGVTITAGAADKSKCFFWNNTYSVYLNSSTETIQLKV